MNKNSFHCLIKMKIKSIKLPSPAECFGKSLQAISNDSNVEEGAHRLERALLRPEWQPRSCQISPTSCRPVRTEENWLGPLAHAHALQNTVKYAPYVRGCGVGKSLRPLSFLSVETSLHAWACLKDWWPKIFTQSCPQTQKTVLGSKFCALVREEKYLTRSQEAFPPGSFGSFVCPEL